MGLLMQFLNGLLSRLRSDAKMGRSLSLNGDVCGEPLNLAMTTGLIAALWGLNCGEGSECSSSVIDGVRGRALNREHGPESEDERWMM